MTDLPTGIYIHLFKETGLARHVEETLNLDPEQCHDEIRAACYLLVKIGLPLIWPENDRARCLALAIGKMERIRKMPIYQEAPGFVEAIDEELDVLHGLLSEIPDSPLHRTYQNAPLFSLIENQSDSPSDTDLS